MSGGWDIDGLALAKFVELRCEKLGLSVREAAARANVSSSCVFRAIRQRPISVGNVLALCLWLDLNPFELLRDPDGRPVVRAGIKPGEAPGRFLAPWAVPLPARDETVSPGVPRGAGGETGEAAS